MQKLKTALMALVATLAVLFGGVTLAAPAQAIAGSTVHYVGYEPGAGVPRLTVVKTNGVRYTMAPGGRAYDVFQICRPSITFKIMYELPGSNVQRQTLNSCYSPLQRGEYDVELNLNN